MASRTLFQHGLWADLRGSLGPAAMRCRIAYLRHVWGVTIGNDCAISSEVELDRGNARGIVIGPGTGIGYDVLILSVDTVGGRTGMQTRIGSDCRIGPRAIIMPGVTIGDGCVVAAGSVVMSDVPSNMLVAGNPARPFERDIRVARRGYQVPAAAASQHAVPSAGRGDPNLQSSMRRDLGG